MNISGNITTLAALNFNLKFKHWTASRQTNEHEALGNAYSAFDKLIDELAEVAIGMGLTLPTDETITMNYSKAAGMDIIKEMLSALDEMEKGVADTGILTITGELRKELNHAVYFLS